MSEPDPSIPAIPLPPLCDCPFCGHPAAYQRGHGIAHLVHCMVCPAEMMAASAVDVLAAWNRRVVLAGKPEIPGT